MSHKSMPLFPHWVWVLIIILAVFALISSAQMINDCVKSGKTRLECMALFNAATSDNGSVIVDTRSR